MARIRKPPLMKTPLFLAIFIFLLAACSKEESEPMRHFAFEEELTSGCGDFQAYKLAPNEKIGLLVWGDRSQLRLSKEKKTFHLSPSSPSGVVLQQFNSEPYNFYCQSVLQGVNQPLESWVSVSGEMDVKLLKDSLNVSPAGITYRLFLEIRNVTLRNTLGEEIVIKKEKFEDVLIQVHPSEHQLKAWRRPSLAN